MDLRRTALLVMTLFWLLAACSTPTDSPGQIDDESPDSSPPAAESVTVAVDEERPSRIELPSGITVDIPAAISANGASVTARDSSGPPLDHLDTSEWEDNSVILRFDGQAEWNEGAFLTVTIPLSGDATAQDFTGLLIDGVIVFVDTTVANARAFHEASVFVIEGVQAVGQVTYELAVDAIQLHGDFVYEVYVASPKRAVDFWVNFFEGYKPPREGIFRVPTRQIPTFAEIASKGCKSDLMAGRPMFFHLDDLPAGWNTPHDTAIVMVHGWQSLGGLLLGRYDSASNEAHCNTWISLMTAYAHEAGDWQWLRDSADLFTFRYDSDFRVRESGRKLADSLVELEQLGYDNIVLVGHSMGGLVSVQARQLMGFPESVAGIVTLGTPFMGSVPLCTGHRVQVIDKTTASYCSRLITPKNPATAARDLLLPLFATVFDGTLDLTSYYDSIWPLTESNKYLSRLWGEERNFSDLSGFYGSSAEPGIKFTFTYISGRSGFTWLTGANDGIVPVYSALASSMFTKDTAIAESLSQLDTSGFTQVARDHGQLVHGCDKCSDGRAGNPTAYDPYFDLVASRILENVSQRAPVDLVSGRVFDAAPNRNWHVTAYDPGNDVFVGTPVVVEEGLFQLNLSTLSPELRVLNPEPGTTLTPTDARIGVLTLLIFDDLNNDGRWSNGEPTHLLNDPGNTFPVFNQQRVNLWYSEQPYALTGTSQTSTGSDVVWTIDSEGDWTLVHYARSADGGSVQVSNDDALAHREFLMGQSLSSGAAGFTLSAVRVLTENW